MKRLFILLPLLLSLLPLLGCSYKTPVGVAYGLDVPLEHQEKVPGKYALRIRAPKEMLDQVVKPGGAPDTSCTQPLEFSASFRESVLFASELVFEEVVVVDQDWEPSPEEQKAQGYAGSISISLYNFGIDIAYPTTFFTAYAYTEARIGTTFQIQDTNGTLLMEGLAGGFGSALKGGWEGCRAGVPSLQESILAAMREMLNDYIDQAYNAPALRPTKALLPSGGVPHPL